MGGVLLRECERASEGSVVLRVCARYRYLRRAGGAEVTRGQGLGYSTYLGTYSTSARCSHMHHKSSTCPACGQGCWACVEYLLHRPVPVQRESRTPLLIEGMEKGSDLLPASCILLPASRCLKCLLQTIDALITPSLPLSRPCYSTGTHGHRDPWLT